MGWFIPDNPFKAYYVIKNEISLTSKYFCLKAIGDGGTETAQCWTRAMAGLDRT